MLHVCEEPHCIYPALPRHVKHGSLGPLRACISPGAYFNLTMTAQTPIAKPKHVLVLLPVHRPGLLRLSADENVCSAEECGKFPEDDTGVVLQW